MSEAAQEVEYDLTIDDQSFRTFDPVITGRDILSIASRSPASGCTVVSIINRGARSIGLDEQVDLREAASQRFRLFEGDRLFRAMLNEREIVWGEGQISALELRLIGEVPDDEDLYFDSKGDRVIEDDELLSLKPKDVERFRSGDPKDQTVDVVLNGEVITVEKGRLSFSDLARLAFPKLFGGALICFTVSFSRGPKRRREGVLLEGGKVRVVEGMVFNVSATDKRSPDLQRLVSEGYAVSVSDGHLLVEEIPFLDRHGAVRRGVFGCALDATSERTVAPRDHVMSFSGGEPHDRNGNPLSALGRTSPRCNTVGSITFQHGFSNKLRDTSGGHRSYADFYEKVRTYEDIILSEVHALDPTATARVGAMPPTASEDDPFVFPDSASARAGTTKLASVFRGEVIAHIGLGGTGAYILDHATKTPVLRNHLIDRDRQYPHNAYRSPGTPSLEEMQPPPFKVEYHAARYGRMKRNIVPHPTKLSAANMELLNGVTFAFLAIDACPEKADIVSELERRDLPFVDVGMGLHLSSNGIGGTLRAVLSTRENRASVRPHIPLDPGGRENIYANNIQISDLNSLNAEMAVQLWKGFRGFYANFAEPIWHFQIETRQMIRSAA